MTRIYLYTLLITLFLGACQSRPKTSDQPVVTVSISPQKYFIKQLTGDKIKVNVMVPPGTSPATYSPTPTQIKSLSESAAYLKIGLIAFEITWGEKLTSTNPDMKWFDLSEGIGLISEEGHYCSAHHDHHEHHHGTNIDPHIWTSLKKGKEILNNTKTALIELFPEMANSITINHANLLVEIDKLDHSLQQLAIEKPGLTFMIFHPAYTYLAQDYGFRQIAIEHEGKTPSPAQLKKTIEQAKAQKVKYIFVQQEFDQKNAKAIANEIGAKVVQVHPLSENWLQEMSAFIQQLQAL
ncbi:zinc ABC transporter substrate-binding protein [Marinilabiliaceae bacterium JC017]|nr:zinc ABC transporter substrate-binding protein [Marinilabiliaceae bacterium JC017]